MPVEISGKTYYTVAERLRLANGPATGDDNGPPTGIQSIVTNVTETGGLVVCHAHVTFQDGRNFTGMALVNMDARSPAERSAPLETCETSAVGRALAFAGWFGSPDGIAGAEELHLAQQRAEQRAQGVVTPAKTTFFPDESSSVTRMSSGASPRPVGNPGGPSPSQVRYASRLWGEAGRPMPPPDFEAMKGVEISRLIDDLKAEAAR